MARGSRKFGLFDSNAKDWDLIIRSIMHEWYNILERDIEKIRHDTWVDFYTDHPSNPVVVFKNEATFNPARVQNIKLPLPILDVYY